MAASTTARDDIIITEPPNNGIVLVWLDDSAEEDPTVKAVLTSLFDNVFTFTDPEACLDLVESTDPNTLCLSILVSGKYGQMLVRDHFQPLNQVKDIYVFCFDTAKHGRWAQTCDKVRCVVSDISKIIQRMQYDIQNKGEQKPPPQQQQQQPDDAQQQPDEPKRQQRERYTDDNNLFDQLALHLLLQSPDDGAEDFTTYCQTHNENNHQGHDDDAAETEVVAQEQQQFFNPNQTIEEWYKPDLFFTNISSNDLSKLWTLRWFIRPFHRQLTSKHETLIKEKTKFTVNHGTWLSNDELDGMKYRIGQIIITTELVLTYADRKTAFNSIENNNDKSSEHKVIFEINIDTNTHDTVPYAEIKKDEVLLWFGARYRLSKLEYIEAPDAYWLIGLNLSSTLDSKPSIHTLYEYYLKELTELNNVHHAFGRILMSKGYYSQAEKWLQIDNHYQELAELAIRQSQYEQAKQYLQQLPDESYDANLLRAYLFILTSNDTIAQGRRLLIKICSEATDKLVRARANKALGFISLIITKHIDQAFDHFTSANEVLCKLLPAIHPDIAISFIGIGYTYYIENHIDDARKSFEKAFTIQKQSLIYNHPDFAKTRNGLAHCLSTKKQTVKQALNEFEYALNILLDTFRREQEHHPEILATMHDIEKLRKEKDLRPRNTLLDYI